MRIILKMDKYNCYLPVEYRKLLLVFLFEMTIQLKKVLITIENILNLDSES